LAALRSGCLKITSFDKQCLWQTFFKGAVISCKNYDYETNIWIYMLDLDSNIWTLRNKILWQQLATANE
jgi:hypothetical protein